MSHTKTFTFSLYPSNRTAKWTLIIKTKLDNGQHYTSTYEIGPQQLTPAQAKRKANKKMARLRMRWTPVGPGFRAEVIDHGLKTR